MGLRTGFLLLVVVLIAGLAALNWGTLSAPTAVSLGVTQVTAPLGLIMLGLTALMGVLFVIYVIYLQSTVLLESRRQAREVQSMRELADKAEASRFTELRTFLESREEARLVRQTEMQAAVVERITLLENTIRARADQSDNTTAAHIGQLEDRFERRTTPTDINPQI